MLATQWIEECRKFFPVAELQLLVFRLADYDMNSSLRTICVVRDQLIMQFE